MYIYLKGAYHLTMMFLSFQHIIEEPAAHFFGITHGHKHSASELGYVATVDADQTPLTSPKRYTHPQKVGSEQTSNMTGFSTPMKAS